MGTLHSAGRHCRCGTSPAPCHWYSLQYHAAHHSVNGCHGSRFGLLSHALLSVAALGLVPPGDGPGPTHTPLLKREPRSPPHDSNIKEDQVPALRFLGSFLLARCAGASPARAVSSALARTLLALPTQRCFSAPLVLCNQWFFLLRSASCCCADTLRRQLLMVNSAFLLLWLPLLSLCQSVVTSSLVPAIVTSSQPGSTIRTTLRGQLSACLGRGLKDPSRKPLLPPGHPSGGSTSSAAAAMLQCSLSSAHR